MYAPNYRLAPEHPYPAGLEDALAAYRWLLAIGLSPSRIARAGDSADEAMDQIASFLDAQWD